MNSEQASFVDYVKLLIDRKPKGLPKLLLLNGAAGTGKSFVIKELVNYADGRCISVAKTIWAASIISGKTINHEFDMNFEGDLSNYINKSHEKCDLLIIDLINYVPKNEFENIEEYLRGLNKIAEPFGGMVVIIAGDFGQVEPIHTNNDDTNSVYHSPLWNGFQMHTLRTNMRQNDPVFWNNLLTTRSKDSFDSKYWQQFVVDENAAIPADAICVMATVNEVNRYTDKKRAKLPEEDNKIQICIENQPEYSVAEYPYGISPFGTNHRLADNKFITKGTKVFITFDIPGANYGHICTITELPPSLNGPIGAYNENTKQNITINRVTITQKGEHFLKVLVSSGYPFQYGWAMTIHKAQGITVDNLIVDPAQIGSNGQLYVALSRVRDSKGVFLLSQIVPGWHVKSSAKWEAINLPTLLTGAATDYN